jgi:hypothetical protein
LLLFLLCFGHSRIISLSKKIAGCMYSRAKIRAAILNLHVASEPTGSKGVLPHATAFCHTSDKSHLELGLWTCTNTFNDIVCTRIFPLPSPSPSLSCCNHILSVHTRPMFGEEYLFLLNKNDSLACSYALCL